MLFRSVESLRQILDGLRVQAAAVDADAADESVKAAEVSDGAGDDGKPAGAGKPATAALGPDNGAVLE